MSKISIAFALALTLLVPAVAMAQWTAPTQSPPNGNASAPLNLSATSQTKAGGLLLNTNGAANGLLVQYGNVGIGSMAPGYKLDVNGDVINNGWYRSRGDTGWYSETYGGGWHMTDTTWIRAYNSKDVYTGGKFRGDSGLCIGTDCRTSWPVAASGSCASGQYVSGINANGTVACSALSGSYASGMWCGLGRDTVDSGGDLTDALGPYFYCQGNDPASSCPSGFTRTNFAIDSRQNVLTERYWTCIYGNSTFGGTSGGSGGTGGTGTGGTGTGSDVR